MWPFPFVQAIFKSQLKVKWDSSNNLKLKTFYMKFSQTSPAVQWTVIKCSNRNGRQSTAFTFVTALFWCRNENASLQLGRRFLVQWLDSFNNVYKFYRLTSALFTCQSEEAAFVSWWRWQEISTLTEQLDDNPTSPREARFRAEELNESTICRF